MPVTLRSVPMRYKNPRTGDYVPFNSIKGEPGMDSVAAELGSRVTALNNSEFVIGSVVEVIGIPVYISSAEFANYPGYSISTPGWYVFARVTPPEGSTVGNAVISGAAGFIISVAEGYIDLAVRFEVAAQSSTVTITYADQQTDTFVFRAVDLAVRNLDYRTTFYVYDLAPYVTWSYALTTDATFTAGSRYFTLADGVYTEAVEGTDWTASSPVLAYYTLEKTYALAVGAFADGVTYYTKSGTEYSEATVTAGDPIPAYYTLDNETYTQAVGTFADGVTYYTKNGDEYSEATVTVGDPIPAYYIENETYTQAVGAFADGVTYYTKSGTEYSEATVTAGDPIPAYYKHSKITISGMSRNITYRFDEIIDSPMEFILPEIEDETHGCWFEMRFRHAGEYSMTLVPPSADVKIATEHTQKETAGINMIDLHYTVIDGLKIWRFLNTHSSIPS